MRVALSLDLDLTKFYESRFHISMFTGSSLSAMLSQRSPRAHASGKKKGCFPPTRQISDATRGCRLIAATSFQLAMRDQHPQEAKDSRGLAAIDRQRQDNPCPLLD
jgi:hypothetical protein